MMEPTVRRSSLVLVDDQEAMCVGLAVLLEREGFRILGRAGTIADGIATVREHRPEVAVVSLDLGDGPGTRLIRHLSGRDARTRFVVYTGFADSALLGDALECGADGFLAKPFGLPLLVEALRLVGDGGRYCDPSLLKLAQVDGQAPPRALSRREAEVLELLASGLTGEEIAQRLVLSPETVRTHIRNAMGKLGARTRTGAVVKALDREEIRREGHAPSAPERIP
jgi:DNA-binding NarL/FixJ family response regulator